MLSPDELAEIFVNVDNLTHVPVRLGQLIDVIIDGDIRSEYPEVADTWIRWIATWLAYGYNEQQVVDIFYALVTSIFAKGQLEPMMSDISKYLENK